MKKNIYLSVPATVPMTKINELVSCFDSNIFNIYYWNRNSRYENLIPKMDAVLFVHPENKFKFNKSSLSTGCRKELAEALKWNKSLLLGYNSVSAGKMKIYDLLVENTYCSGMSGSSEVAQELLRKFLKEKDQELQLSFEENIPVELGRLCSKHELQIYERRLLLKLK